MTQPELEALLGRSLSSTETTNFDLYLDIAKQSLERLLCVSIETQPEGSTATARTFRSREGYSTVFTDIFTEAAVTVDGEAISYYPAFFDDRNAAFYNSVVLDEVESQERDVVITAKWGFAAIPNDLLSLWAQLFAITAKRKSTSRVKSKKNEDFSVTFADVTDDQAFLDDNRRTLAKYTMCGIGYIRHGEV